MRSIEMTGKTVEDAVKAGLRELGCDSSDVTIDVLHMGSPGLFGMFGKLAKVRLTVKEEDPALDFDLSDISLSLKPGKAPKAKPERKAEEKKAEPKPAEPAKAEAPKAEEPAKEAPKAEEEKAEKPAAPVREEKPEAESKPVREKSERPARKPRKAEDKPEKTERPAPVKKDEEPFEPSDPEKLGEAGKLAYDFLKNVTEKMGVTVGIRVVEAEDHLSVSMMGDTLGILIGRRGDTLDALQYLTSLQVNKHRDGYMRVSLDTENYRQKREEALTKLAMRMAARARKTGRKVTLEPMNPYERRVLHSALQNNAYVTTHSEGEEPYRRVVITLKQDAE
ncbi:MAG: Jag N-terminal domain-containing protein [Clostridia bacterium]|nr:Jag N-terminal domain-containing protein [Clostridia bacterium]